MRQEQRFPAAERIVPLPVNISAMLSDKEKAFLDYWQQNRVKKGKATYQFFHSLPLGIIFALPILVFFLLEAQRDRALITPVDLVLICIGIFLIAAFYGVFRSKFDWEKNEDLYQAILKKQEKEDKAAG